MSRSDFKFGKTTCTNLHEVVDLIKGLKSRDEGKLFLDSFCKHIKGISGLSGEPHLSKFIQRNYGSESIQLHEFLSLPFWEEPKHEAVPAREGLSKKVGRKRRGLPEDPRLVRPDEGSLPGHETSSDPS